MKRLVVSIFTLFLLSAGGAAQETAKFAQLGDFRLENGEIIRDCRIGYRTFGELNREKSNAVLFPTWFTGTTNDLIDQVGPGKLIDSSQYFVIAVDALGNGVSSSPSNSETQARLRFPQFSIRDMVNTQYRLITEELKIPHLHAVIGISMGGMQVFQWIVSYPEFVDKAIPIVGSPRLTAYDLLLWQTQINAIEESAKWNQGEYTGRPGIKTLGGIMALAITTPQNVNESTTRSQFPQFMALWERLTQAFDVNDRYRQMQAMMEHDISRAFSGSMERAAAAVRADLLIVVASQDHTVNPQPALDFARLLRATVINLQGDCGHLATVCEKDKLIPVISRFLKE